MKATGIVRRIDDLGRVVIPKEIRRTLKIREGMPMEIFTDVSGEVILKKYSPVGEMSTLAQAYAEALVSLTGQAAAVCDTEQVIALAGPAKKEALHKALSPQLYHQRGENCAGGPGDPRRRAGSVPGGFSRRPYGRGDAAERGPLPRQGQRGNTGKPAGGFHVPFQTAGSVTASLVSFPKMPDNPGETAGGFWSI